MLVAQSCPTLCDPMDSSLPGSSAHGILSQASPGKNTGVDYHFLLHGIFLTQGSNSGLLHCRQTFYHLSHEGRSPNKLVISQNTKKEKAFRFLKNSFTKGSHDGIPGSF